MNNIIFIDDNKEYADHFIREAKSKNINVTHKKSFDGLKEILPKFSHKFAAVILDIKCLLHDDQEIEDANFIGTAMKYLDQSIPNFPRLILTGDDTEFNNLKKYYTDEKLFLKTPQDLEKLFDNIQYYVDNSEDLKIKREHSSIFEIFENRWMGSEGEKLTLKILKEGLTTSDKNQFKGILADIRSMQERLYKTINKIDKQVVPNNMFRNNGMINFNQLMKHLSGNPDRNRNFQPTTKVYQNSTIDNLSKTIYWSCGEYIHEDPSRTYFISDNTLKSLTYALLELLLWAKQYLK